MAPLLSRSIRGPSLLLSVAGCVLLLAGEAGAQKRSHLVRRGVPLREVARALPGAGIEPTSGDSPLAHLSAFTGNLGVFVQVRPHPGTSGAAGTFVVSGVPAGATMLAAWVQITSFESDAAREVGLIFDGVQLEQKLADAVDPGGIYHCSMFRFEVTGLVLGNGSFPYLAVPGPQYAFGDSLIVVYQHPSLTGKIIAIHDGSESLRESTTTTLFEGMPAGSGTLSLFTQADEADIPGGERVRFNAQTIAGPGELFSANLGPYASLLSLPVKTVAGDNVLEVSTGEDWFGLHLAVLSIESAVTLDFETDDAGIPLVNGQDVQSGEEFGVRVDVDGFPASGLSAAIFDSTPGGPNDPSQDRDLLVGRGNVLILQERPLQSVPGIYDRPNDDAGGGTFTFGFHQPVTPRSLDLIDIDPGPDFAVVRLIDSAGRRRTYTVPAGWTEDLVANGPPARRTLDLGRLDPQAGFIGAATAAQDAGFVAAQVVAIEVVLGGSGALDNLTFVPASPPLPRSTGLVPQSIRRPRF